MGFLNFVWQFRSVRLLIFLNILFNAYGFVDSQKVSQPISAWQAEVCMSQSQIVAPEKQKGLTVGPLFLMNLTEIQNNYEFSTNLVGDREFDGHTAKSFPCHSNGFLYSAVFFENLTRGPPLKS